MNLFVPLEVRELMKAAVLAWADFTTVLIENEVRKTNCACDGIIAGRALAPCALRYDVISVSMGGVK